MEQGEMVEITHCISCQDKATLKTPEATVRDLGSLLLPISLSLSGKPLFPNRQSSLLTRHREKQNAKTMSDCWPWVSPSPSLSFISFPIKQEVWVLLCSYPQGPAPQLVILFFCFTGMYFGLSLKPPTKT